MSQSSKIITLVSLLFSIVTSMNPPLWAEKFATDFSVRLSNFRTKGKYWYNGVENTQKLDFENGNTVQLCKPILPVNTSCSLLTVDSTTYFIFPEKEICCSQQAFSVRREDWLDDFNFLGETQIQGQLFFQWESSEKTLTYFEDQSAQRRPKREIHAHGRLQFDYATNTYTESFDADKVFDVPSYCKKSCQGFKPSEKHNQKELRE